MKRLDPSKYRATPRSSDYQTLGQRIKWLRLAMMPPMTQQQLADRARIGIRIIIDIENDRPTKSEIRSLNKIANALECNLFFNLYRRNRQAYRSAGQCQPVVPELPPCPKWTGTISAKDHARVVRTLRWPWKAQYQRELFRRYIKTSVNAGKTIVEPGTEDTPHTPPDTP